MISFVVNSKAEEIPHYMQQHIKEYLRDQCTDETLEQVLSWLQTREGEAFLHQQIDESTRRLAKNEVPLHPKVPTEMIFDRIQKSKENPSRTHWILMWLTAILFMPTVLSQCQKIGAFHGLL